MAKISLEIWRMDVMTKNF